MSFGVTVDGFVTKRLADIKLEIETTLKATFGAGINLSAESPLGQLVGIFAEREANLWELAEGVYNSAYPDTAEGVGLDNAVALIGLARQGETYSTVSADLEGDPATLIPQGSIVSVDGDPDARFVLDQDVTLDGAGEGTGAFTAESAGAVAAPAASLTVIETPVAGWDTVTNPLDAEIGDEVETDSELKIRRAASIQRAGAGTAEAIRSDLLAVDGVTAALVFENTTEVTDGFGRPAKSFEAVVEGGTDADIAQVIWDDKPAGIATYGTETVVVTDSQGFDHDVKFSRPTTVDIWVELDLTTTAAYPVNGDDLVKAAVLAYGDALSLNDDVIVYPSLVAALAAVPGIIDVVVRVGTAVNPTLDDNVEIDTFEVASFDTSRIEVNS